MSRTPLRTPHQGILTVLSVLLVVTTSTATLGQQLFEDDGQVAPDTFAVLGRGLDLTNQELSLRLSQATFDRADRVLIARDDTFPDSLASGVLQGDAPLLLLAGDRAASAPIVEEIQRLGATAAVLLGGEAALSQDLAASLTDLGLAVDRIAGADRIDTAARVASFLGSQHDVIIVARAFGPPEGDPTAAFADALAGGALAARTGWPILLTASNELSPASRAVIETASPNEVLLLGGTAALGVAVEQAIADIVPQVRRLAGANRFETAVAVAEVLGQPTAAQARTMTIVDGVSPDAWAGGFAVAARSAAFDAPVLLAADTIPEATRAWVEAGLSPTSGGEVVVTCVVGYQTCEEARRATGLPANPLFSFTPAPTAFVAADEPVTVAVNPAALGAGQQLTWSTVCSNTEEEVARDGGVAELDSTASASFTLPDGVGALECVVEVEVSFTNGQTGSARTRFEAPDSPFGPPLVDLLPVHFGISSSQATTTALAMDVDIRCTGGDQTQTQEQRRVASIIVEGTEYASTFGVPSSFHRPDAFCRVTTTHVPEAEDPRWTFGPDGGTDQVIRFGSGTVAEIDLGELPDGATDAHLRWEVSLTDEQPSPPPPVDIPVLLEVHYPDITFACADGTARTEPDGPFGFLAYTVADDQECTIGTAEGREVLAVIPGQPEQVFAERTLTLPDGIGTVLLFDAPRSRRLRF